MSGEEPLISMVEVADRLGVSIKTFRHWRAHRRAPQGYQLGRRVQFRWSEVEVWLQQQREPDRHLKPVAAPASQRGTGQRRTTRTA